MGEPAWFGAEAPARGAVGRWRGGAARRSPGWGDAARLSSLSLTTEGPRPTAGGR